MFCKLKFFWQRITRGWDDSDTWDLGHTIAKFTLPRLIRFKELNATIGGTPMDFVGPNDEPDCAAWDAVIDKMIYALERIVKDDAYDHVIYPPDYKHGYTTKPSDDGRPCVTQVPNDPRPLDYSKVEEIEKKIEEGLGLFSKYFRNLWW